VGCEGDLDRDGLAKPGKRAMEDGLKPPCPSLLHRHVRRFIDISNDKPRFSIDLSQFLKKNPQNLKFKFELVFDRFSRFSVKLVETDFGPHIDI
jgi:hypothetical protein